MIHEQVESAARQYQQSVMYVVTRNSQNALKTVA